MKIFLTFITVYLLTACGRPLSQDEVNQIEQRHISEIHYTLKDGRKVVCLRYNSRTNSSISCDWSHG